MKRYEPMRSGDEYDAMTGWRRFHRFRAGQRSAIKRIYRRRERRAIKAMDRTEVLR